ncbi:hypothetical protein GGR56DRAFT_692279 [Xylariaceae sp. FL0804]|nr:hypothetical protein GGR56DRAFT_692279 [Xylariaceae sp. FL0804]
MNFNSAPSSQAEQPAAAAQVGQPASAQQYHDEDPMPSDLSDYHSEEDYPDSEQPAAAQIGQPAPAQQYSDENPMPSSVIEYYSDDSDYPDSDSTSELLRAGRRPPIAAFPSPFNYEATDDGRLLPAFSAAQLADIEAVLRGLARGTYPRINAIPTALNAYNCAQARGRPGRRPWAYFHSVITDLDPLPGYISAYVGVRPWDRRPTGRRGTPPFDPLPIRLDGGVLEDLQTPWRSMRSGWSGLLEDKEEGEEEEKDGQAAATMTARYRFVCFIHRHRVERRNCREKAVYTISIWDREWEELTWHDVYPYGREIRRNEIRAFWRVVAMPGLAPAMRIKFTKQLRYRTAYHTCERVEGAIHGPIAPRHTLWAVMAIAVRHMNRGGRDAHVSIVPDRLELFGGQARELLPQLFAHLLWLLYVEKVEMPSRSRTGSPFSPLASPLLPDGSHRQQQQQQRMLAARRFAVNAHRLPWLWAGARRCLADRGVVEAGVGGGGGGGGGRGAELLQALRL